jgi:aliphatic sulfonates family ABC transporter substrate-binding protein
MTLEKSMKIRRLSLIVSLAAFFGTAAFAQDLNISYVKAPFNLQNMVIKHNGMLEKEFKGEDVQIKWHNITSGAKQTQAMASGALDVAGTMNTASVLMANAEGNPIRIATGVAHPSKVFGLVGKPGADYSVKDLKGKTVVGPKGTVLHQMLVAALVKNGMSEKDVNFISMDIPKGMTAVLAGQADAALVAASGIMKSNAAGAKTIVTADGLIEPNLVVTTSEKFAKEHPEQLERVVKVYKEALAWIQKNPKEALEIGAKEHGITLEEAEKLAQWSNYYSKLTEADVKALAADLQFLKDNDMVRKDVDVKKIVLPMAFT